MADNEFGTPGSPNAAILQNILGAQNELREPQSENEALLKAIYEKGFEPVYTARDEAVAAAGDAEIAKDAAEAAAAEARQIATMVYVDDEGKVMVNDEGGE